MAIAEQIEQWTRRIEQDVAHIQDRQGKLARRIESLDAQVTRLMDRIVALERLLEKED